MTTAAVDALAVLVDHLEAVLAEIGDTMRVLAATRDHAHDDDLNALVECHLNLQTLSRRLKARAR
jgi:hypothetical protein